MSRGNRIYTHWPMTGDLPANLSSNYTGYRRLDTALGMGFALGFFFLAASFWAVWRDLPWIGPLPQPSRFPEYLQAWACLIPNALGAKSLCYETATSYKAWAQNVPWSVAYARPALAGAITLFGSLAGAYLGVSVRPLEKVIEGAEVKEGKSALALLQARLLGGKPAFIRLHPRISLPRDTMGRHALVYGSSGSGKTTILWPLIEQAMRSKRNAKSFIFDPKGDFAKGTSDRRTVIISPWDERSAAWQISQDITTEDQARSFSAAFTAAEKNPYFQKVAQDILTGVLVSLIHSYGDKWGWSEFFKLSTQSTTNLYRMLLANFAEGAYALENPEEKQASTNRSTFSAAISPLMVLAKAWGDGKERQRISMRGWVSDAWTGPKHLIFQGNEGKADAFFIGAMLDQAARAMVNPSFPDNKARSIFFFLDELPALGRVDGLKDLLDKGRSKGAVCILGYQDNSQLAEIYGADAAKGFNSMVATHIVCQINPGETRDFVAKSLGRQRVEKITQSHNTKDKSGVNASYAIEERDAILSSDLTDTLGVCKLKPDGKDGKDWGIRAIVSTGGELARLTFPGHEAKDKRPQRIAADWTLNERQRQEKNQ